MKLFSKNAAGPLMALVLAGMFLASCAGNRYMVSGVVRDNAGKGVQGVVVSDGYTCVLTDKKGRYELQRDTAASFIHISVPSGYSAAGEEGYGSFPDFFRPAFPAEGDRLARYRADFDVVPLGVPSNKFILFGVGDPQSNNDEHIERFRTQTISDLRQTLASYGSDTHAVGLALGDIVGRGTPESFLGQKAAMGEAGFPFLTTVGNHDKDAVDWTGEAYSGAFGPRWYSYNAGDVHFVSMDNVNEFTAHEKGAGIKSAGFSDAQLEWLRRDLSFVAKDKMVVLFYHIPERDYSNHVNHDEVFSLISEYANSIAVCGHTHYFEGFNSNGYGVPEYILGAACGYFWRSDCGGDGVPNGYVVFEIDGNRVSNAYFKGTDQPRDYQIRLYRGNERFGGEHAMYDYGFDGSTIIANVFFAGQGGPWKIEVYEDGQLSGEMEAMDPSVPDHWARGYHTGVKTFPLKSSLAPNKHQFRYKLKNPRASVEVRATDPWGNVYRQDRFWSNGDFADIDGSFRNN